MSTNDTFLAVFLGSKTSAKMAAWNALPEAEPPYARRLAALRKLAAA